MAAPYQFVPVELTTLDTMVGQSRVADMGDRALGGENAWIGFAAERAVIRAMNNACGEHKALEPNTRAYDIKLQQSGKVLKVEVKTRAVTEGWTHPEKFEWVTVPSHDGREPIKQAADLVVFCWYSREKPNVLWVLGYVHGADEFKRRSVYYAEDEPLPRGGWAGPGGAYSIEVKQLRPIPRGLLKEHE